MVIAGCKDKEPKYEIYENHDISACGVEDPLRNIEWLAETYQELINSKDMSQSSISLYQVIDKDEYIFAISRPWSDEHYFTINYRNCSGEHVFHWNTVTSPNDYYEDFMKDKEFVAILFQLTKQ